jgi:uncharacterized SAM-binding protein YcdF (DUF218 family)
MFFVLSKALWMAARPSSLLLLLGCAGIVLAWGRRSRLGLTLASLSLGSFLLILVLPIDDWVGLPLEDRFPQIADPPAEVAGIITVGGATSQPMSEERGIPSLDGAAERMTAFVALARRYPHARLAFTGGSGELHPGSETEAQTARRLFDSLGLADRDVIYEGRSRTTWENALFLHEMVRPPPGELWILVDSAAHLPRTVGVFRHVGWTVLPWPVGYKAGHSPEVQYFAALGGRLVNLDFAIHEWIGLVAYRLLGHTDTLFPGPRPASSTTS